MIKQGVSQFLSREITFDGLIYNEAERTVELTFSSEEMIERWFGYEVLSHDEDAVDLSWLKEGGVVLLNHDIDEQIGAVIDVWLDKIKRKCKAEIKISRSSKGEEIWQDIIDGIRRNVSVGYLVQEVTVEGQKDGKNIYKITKWKPLEVSIVSIPADITVGIGRGFIKQIEKFYFLTGGKEMEQEKKEKIIENLKGGEEMEQERKRVSEILMLAERHNAVDIAKEAINSGLSVEEFSKKILERYNMKKVEVDAQVGLSKREIKQYSIVRAIRAMLEGNWDLAPFEKEVSDELANRIGKPAQGFYVPVDIYDNTMVRALQKGEGTAGGYTVATELLVEQFIELLRDKLVVRKLGARVLSGLIGDIAIPKQTGGATAYWVNEGVAPAESQQAFGQVVLRPKTVGAYTDITRKLLLQSSLDVESFVREDIMLTIALAIDKAAIAGSGQNNQPLGILNTTGVALVTTGGSVGYEHVVKLETELASANADVGKLAYLTNARVRGILKTTFINPNYSAIPIWMDAGTGDGTGIVNGYKAMVSNQVPNNLGENQNRSAIIFGNWDDLIIGEWGAIDIQVNPYVLGTSGTVRVRILQDVDIAIRHPESFAVIKDISA